MSFFDHIYNNAIISSRNNIDAAEYLYNLSPNYTVEEKENFFCVQNYGNVKARYPYSLSFSPFHCYLVLHTINGQGQITYDNQTYILSPNSFLFLSCDTEFLVSISGSSIWHYQRLYFTGSYSSILYHNFIKNASSVYQSIPASCSLHTFQHLIDYLVQEDFSALICSSLINTFLTNLVVEQNQQYRSSSIPKYIVKIQELLNTQYYNNFDLDNLSAQFQISKYTLSKDFVKYLNVSPIEYLIQQRMQAAKHLLVNTNYTVSEIGIRVGIYNVTHFIHLFKKRIGVTPLQYRKKVSQDLIVFDTY